MQKRVASTSPKTPTHSTTIPVLDGTIKKISFHSSKTGIATEELTEEMASTGNFFGLKVYGDSMEPKISNGDVVIVRQQSDAESGDIVIALVNGQDTTCRRLKKYAEGIMLLSNNPKYEPLVFSKQDITNNSVEIIGRVMELRAKF